mmetsp:Transcript_33573/g.60217  ORF Transcript_33573/g.60217 Transcript_33573/m.60217 type:complete len:81 (+) Transcript_33573:392-634(+)
MRTCFCPSAHTSGQHTTIGSSPSYPAFLTHHKQSCQMAAVSLSNMTCVCLPIFTSCFWVVFAAVWQGCVRVLGGDVLVLL